MQQNLQRSLRLLCRQQCRRKLHSTTTVNQSKQVAASSSNHDSGQSPGLRFQEEASVGREENIADSEKENGLLLKQTYARNEKSQLGSKVDIYLASLRAEGKEPLLEDLLHLRPKRNPPQLGSEKYSSAYRNLIDRMCLSFSKKQLQHFTKELGLGIVPRKDRKKTEYAEAIMQSWGWQNLRDIEKRKKEASEVTVQSFPVTASELFLLLGKDGSQLLQISRDYKVHISVTSEPLAIRIEGFKASLKKLRELIHIMRKSIIEETIQLPVYSRMTSSLLQQVSRVAEAYIESVDSNGKVRIVANDPARLEMAKRIATRAAINIDHTSNVTVLSCLQPDNENAIDTSELSKAPYALYPFTAEWAVPWAAQSKGTFRSRRVGAARDLSMTPENEPQALFSSTKGTLFNMDCAATSLNDVIDGAFTSSVGPRTITASTGHLLVSSSSRENRGELFPPLPGEWGYGRYLTWLKGDVNRAFVPALPSPLHAAPPSQEKIIHRLTYRRVRQTRWDKATPARVIHAEVIIKEQAPASVQLAKTVGGEGIAYLEDNAYEKEIPEERVETIGDPPFEEMSTTEPLQHEIHASTDPSGTSELIPQGSLDYPSDQAGLSTKADGNMGHAGTDTVDPIRSSEILSEPGVSENEGMAVIKVGTTKHEETFPSEMNSGGVTQERYNEEGEKVRQSEFVDIVAPLSSHEGETQLDMSGEPVCTLGNELELLVALPDRPMDVKLTVKDSVQHMDLKSNSALNDYFVQLKEFLNNRLSKNPEPPLIISQDNEVFYLDSNISVRQSVEVLKVGPTIAPDVDSSESDLSRHTITTVTESIYDLETSQKLVNCQISSVCLSPDKWEDFYKDLDGLTSFGYQSASKLSLKASDIDEDGSL